MNKLGLRINKVYEGATPLPCINSGEWKRKCEDLRPVIKLFENIDKGKYITLLSFSAEGAYITVCNSISGRPEDSLAAWIYIPNNIDIKVEEILQLISAVKDEISKVDLHEETIKPLFEKTYPETVSIAYTPSSTEKVYAKRRVAQAQMTDLLGDKLYQTYYSDYRFIILEDENSPKVTSPRVADITGKKLEQLCIFFPPREEDLRDGIIVRFDDADKTPFTSPVRKKKGDIVNLVFERSGFLPVHHKEQVDETSQFCKTPKDSEWKIEVVKSRFRIYADFNGKDLGGRATIKINGKPLANSSLIIEEGKAKKAKVTVSVNNFVTEEREVNLTNGQPVHFRLHRADRKQDYRIELTDGTEALMTLKSKSLPESATVSPLKEYDYINGVLRFSNESATKERAIGFIMALMLGAVIWGAVALWDWIIADDSGQTQTEQTHSPSTSDYTGGNATTSADPQGANQAPISSSSRAIAYLDNAQGEWIRDSLEVYPELAGLYDEMNGYNFDGVLHRESELSGSQRFAELANAIKNNKHKLFNGLYCNDNKMTLSRYIDRLNKEETATPASSTREGALTEVAKKHDKQNQNKANDVEPNTSTTGRGEEVPNS